MLQPFGGKPIIVIGPVLQSMSAPGGIVHCSYRECKFVVSKRAIPFRRIAESRASVRQQCLRSTFLSTD